MSWELSKENIKPIPQGRKMHSLQTALCSETKELAAKRHEFECELRTDESDDPLDVWFRYVQWVQQNYPSGGKESGFLDLCKKAVYKFFKDTRYHNDPRYIYIWIAYANLCGSQSNDVYNLMFQDNIGSEITQFYKSWSWDMESQGNIKKANEILNIGMNRNAQPSEELAQYYSKFQERVAKKIQDEQEFAGQPSFLPNNPEPQRKALLALKTHGKSAPVNRVGHALSRKNQSNVLTTSKLLPASSNKKTIVYVEDENAMQSGPTANMNTVLPGSYESSQENLQKPGPWNKAKIKTKGTSKSAFVTAQTTAIHVPAQTFEIYQENSDNEQQKPTKVKTAFNTALSELKDIKPPMFIQEPFDPSKRPMYDKTAVYGGPEEMSFEELRAMRIEEKQKKIQQEELLNKCMLMEQELLRKQQMIEELRNAPKESKCDTKPESPLRKEIEPKNKIQIYQPEEAMDEGEPVFKHANHVHTGKIETYEDEELMDQNDFDFELVAATSKPVAQERTYGKVFDDPKFADEMPAQKEEAALSPNARSESSMIRSLWNVSISEGTDTNGDMEDFTFCNNKPPTNSIFQNNGPLNIYTDDDELKQSEADKENCPPVGTQQPVTKRNLSGILQPSLDFPCEEIEHDPIHIVQSIEVVNGTLAEKTPAGFNTSSEATPRPNVTPSTRNLCSTRFDSCDGFTTENLKAIDDLSIIMESSREYWSKSSISSSSNNSSCHSFGIMSKIHNQTANTASKTCSTIIEDESIKCDIKSPESNITQNKALSSQEDKQVENNVESFVNERGFIDPFEDAVIGVLLEKVSPPVHDRPGFHRINQPLPKTLLNVPLVVGDGVNSYSMRKLIAEGAYARVIDATRIEDGQKSVIKVQKPNCYWEYYICSEIFNRLNLSGLGNYANGFSCIDDAYFYDDGSILTMRNNQYGTLLNVSNYYKMNGKTMPCELAVLLTIQALFIMEALQSCEIIHGDFKPDNIMLSSKISEEAICPEMFGTKRKVNLQLIDYGRSIDMRLMPRDAKFCQTVATKGFQTPEMRDDKPWTYQIDIYGFIVTLHVLLFGTYIDIIKRRERWCTNKKIKRYWVGGAILDEMVDTLLNIPDCNNLPDLSQFRLKLEKCLLESPLSSVAKAVRELNTLIK